MVKLDCGGHRLRHFGRRRQPSLSKFIQSCTGPDTDATIGKQRHTHLSDTEFNVSPANVVQDGVPDVEQGQVEGEWRVVELVEEKTEHILGVLNVVTRQDGAHRDPVLEKQM